VANALGHPSTNRLTPFFFDNTDPDGMERVLASIGGRLGQTLCIVISKSGGTKETRNGMLEAVAAYKKASLDFSRHAVAITRDDSQLHKVATQSGWITTFPMWDWVGGRTSELSAVGLLPAALQGIDVQGIVAGAKACDEITRAKTLGENPAAQLALMWFHAGGGIGSKNMVALPYSDRLDLFSKYLQQLVMESLGKELDRNGSVVHQGITVLGNKGATDQHSYIQQLRDGQHDFFATFIEVLRPSRPTGVYVDAGFTSDDYLAGFYLGTRQALAENSREVMTITIDEVSPQSVGVLIALFERAVGLYASLINVNAYHQPGVEAGKKAAESVLALQLRIVSFLKSRPGQSFDCSEIAKALDVPLEVEHVFKICERLAFKPDSGMLKKTFKRFIESKFSLAGNSE
jgi:glucose-6-phosphate isomerase